MRVRFTCRFFTLIVLFQSLPLMAEMQEEKDAGYLPEIHGTIRAKYELEPEYMENRFQVRNARLGASGKIGSLVDYYKVEADFCDRGEFKVVDAYARVAFDKSFKIQVGQMRIPFSVDATRAPHVRYFANRSFIAKQVGNVRGVGAKAIFKVPDLPVNVEAGVFNTATISEHQVWQREMSYAGKINCKLDNVTIEAGVESIVPDSIRINLIDGTVSWSAGRWMLEGEYIYKHYTGNAFEACHAYNVMADYHIPLKKGLFNQVSFQGRWDGMTDHSDGKRNDDGRLELTEQARKRLSLGTTLSYIRKGVRTDIRLNYENYFYHHDAVVASGDRDKVVVELVVRF
ncbi:MAG: porin [Muribaculaceae bacterium]|nr:porin [Muribaculaceae bacterium]